MNQNITEKEVGKEVYNWLATVDQYIAELANIHPDEEFEESAFSPVSGWNVDTIPQIYQESNGDPQWGVEAWMEAIFSGDDEEFEEPGETEVALVMAVGEAYLAVSRGTLNDPHIVRWSEQVDDIVVQVGVLEKRLQSLDQDSPEAEYVLKCLIRMDEKQRIMEHRISTRVEELARA